MAKINLPKQRTTEYFANPLKRTAAFLIDLLILQLVVISAFRSYFSKIIPISTDFQSSYNYLSSNPEIINQTYTAMIAISVLILFYFVYLEHRYKQTPGKMIFNIYVKSTKGKELTFWQPIIRSIFLLPVFPLFLLWLIDPILMFFKGERLSEMISKTQTMEVYPI